MKFRHLGAWLCLLASVVCACACSSSSNGAKSSATAACTSMCTHLINDLGMCGKSVDQPGCVAECEDHVNGGDSTEAEVNCGASAADCTAWDSCGDLL